MMARVGVVFLTRDGVACTVREARPDDAEQLLAGIRAVIDEQLDGVISRPGEMTFTVDQERAWISSHAETDNSILLVAEHDGALVGWLDVRGGRRLLERHAATCGISVARAWRNRGVGTALLQTMLDWAAGSPVIDKIKLGVVAQNHGARRLYRRLGFVEEGYQRHEFRKADGTYLDNVLMCRFVKDPARV